MLDRSASILRALTFLASACTRLGTKQRAFSSKNVGLSVPSPFSAKHPALALVASVHPTSGASRYHEGAVPGGRNAVAPFCSSVPELTAVHGRLVSTCSFSVWWPSRSAYLDALAVPTPVCPVAHQ